MEGTNGLVHTRGYAVNGVDSRCDNNATLITKISE